MPQGKPDDGVYKVCECEEPHNCSKKHGAYYYKISAKGSGGTRKRPRGGPYRLKSEAEAARDEARTDYRQGVRKPVGKKTLGQIIDEFIVEMRRRKQPLSPTTDDGYESDLLEWKHLLGHVPVEEYQRDGVHLINEAVKELAKDRGERPPHYMGRWVRFRSKATLEKYRRELRLCLNWAKDHKNYITVNHAAVQPYFLRGEDNVNREEMVWGEVPDVPIELRWGPTGTAKFLDHLAEHATADEAALYNMYTVSAARRGEWTGASWPFLRHGGLDVRWTLCQTSKKLVCPVPGCGQVHPNRWLKPKPKRLNSERFLFLPDWALDMLGEHKERQEEKKAAAGRSWVDHQLVFCLEDGTPLRPTFVTDRFKQLVEGAGLPEIRLHDLRHNAASLYLAAGIPPSIVAKYTGHDEAVLQKIYHHLDIELHRRRFAEAVDIVTSRRGGYMLGTSHDPEGLAKVIPLQRFRRSGA